MKYNVLMLIGLLSVSLSALSWDWGKKKAPAPVAQPKKTEWVSAKTRSFKTNDEASTKCQDACYGAKKTWTQSWQCPNWKHPIKKCTCECK